MKRSIFITIKEFLSKRSKKPWACFETPGPDADGRVQFSISWNKAFVETLHKAGYEAMTQEELVQMFFISMRMLPEDILEEEKETVNPAETPRLTSEANILKR